MWKSLTLLILVLSAVSARTKRDDPLELKFVQVITRHGARSAFDELPNNPAVWNCQLNTFSISSINKQPLDVLYRKKYIPNRQHLQGNCPQGYLTEQGWENHQTLGKHWRERYVKKMQFLPETLNTSLMYFRSTDSPRTVESVQANLLGLYPLKNRPSSTIIDVYTMDTSTENLLPSTTCPVLMNACHDVQNSTSWLREMENITSLENYLKNAWNTTTLPWWIGIFDNLYSRSFHGIAFPSAVTKQVYKKLKDIALFQLKELYRPEDVKMLGIGRFVDELISTFDHVITPTQKDPVIYVHYSAHDLTIGLLLSVYNALDSIPSWPRYASSLQFELYYHHDLQEYMVQVLYNGEVINIPPCGTNTLCRFSIFKKISMKYVPADYDLQCNKEQMYAQTDKYSQFMC